MLDEVHLRWFNLRSRRSGYDDVYNSKIDPRTSNAFGAAASRMGHGEVRNDVGYDRGFGRIQVFPLNENILRPDLMFNNGYEYMARWMSRTPQSRTDRFMGGGLRNGMPVTIVTKKHPSETLSQDLIAVDIQRGRDNGVPSYNAFREFCGLPRAHFFAALPGGLWDHSPFATFKLRKTYRHPDDIDLIVGGMTETPRRKSTLGPTFQCLIAYQFYLYKHGDRFWYERTFKENPLAAFTPAQLAQIKQTTYTKILCSTMKNVGGIMHSFQPRLMERPDMPRNSPVACDIILRGNPLGFDITPFAQQLLQLGGRRRQAPRKWIYSPLNPAMRDLLIHEYPISHQQYV